VVVVGVNGSWQENSECDTLCKDPVAGGIMGYLRNREKASSWESKEQSNRRCKS